MGFGANAIWANLPENDLKFVKTVHEIFSYSMSLNQQDTAYPESDH